MLKELKFDDDFMELFSINRFSTKQSTQEAGLELQRTPVISRAFGTGRLNWNAKKEPIASPLGR